VKGVIPSLQNSSLLLFFEKIIKNLLKNQSKGLQTLASLGLDPPLLDRRGVFGVKKYAY
jgi:hypothetical protein